MYIHVYIMLTVSDLIHNKISMNTKYT